MGYLTASALIACAIVMGIKARRFNLTLPACAVFILKGIQDDKRALSDVRSTSLLNALSRTGDPIPMRLWAVDEATPILKALRCAAPDAATLYAVYHGNRLTAFKDEGDLMRTALMDSSAQIGDMKYSPVA